MKEELEKLLELWDRRASRAEAAYQDTGAARYLTEQRNAEAVADAVRLALSKVDGNRAAATLKSLKGQVRTIRDLNKDDIRDKAIETLLWEIEHCEV